MRDIIRRDLDFDRGSSQEFPGRAVADHMGLAYGPFAPVDQSHESEPGKVNTEVQNSWFEKLSSWTPPEGYERAYERWKESLRQDRSMGMRGRATSRILVGHGLPSPVDVGLRVHRTWGVPVIPGSAVKGLLSQYIETLYGPENPSHHPDDPEHPEPERAPYQGVVWDGSTIKFGPGEIYRELFGAPNATTDDDFASDRQEATPKVGAQKGRITFHDAWMVPNGDDHRPFARDVLTVHQKTFYNADGRDEWPSDHDEPNPVSFLTVRPETQFLFGLSGDPEWTKFAGELLQNALAEWGIGGKTTSGYGRFDENAWRIDPNPTDLLARESEWAERVSEWFDEHPTNGLSVKDRLKLFDEEFAEELLETQPQKHHRHGIWLVIRERTLSDSRTSDFRNRWRDFLEDGEVDVRDWGLSPGDSGFPVDIQNPKALDIGHWLQEWVLERELFDTEEWAPEHVAELESDFFDAFFEELMVEQVDDSKEIRRIVEFFVPRNDSTASFWSGTIEEMLE